MDSDSDSQEFRKIIFGKSVADLSASANSASFVFPEYLFTTIVSHTTLPKTRGCILE